MRWPPTSTSSATCSSHRPKNCGRRERDLSTLMKPPAHSPGVVIKFRTNARFPSSRGPTVHKKPPLVGNSIDASMITLPVACFATSD
jgi:hypothetical protein